MQNVKLGRAIVDVMDLTPELFNMNSWGRVTACGTVACLAGHAMLLSGYTCKGTGGLFYRPDGTLVFDEAGEARCLLGMEYEEIRIGFGSEIWHDYVEGPDRFRKLVEESEGQC
jgi:hypothetical protein